MQQTVNAAAAALGLHTVPRHVGIIMDGNGRWAQQHALPRAMGHRRGVETLRDIISMSGEIGMQVLSLYAFSTENWKRSVDEVGVLMGLLVEFMHQEIDNLHRNRVQLRYMGDLHALSDKVQQALAYGKKRTAHNDGLIVNIALNYGGRDELLRAVRAMARAGVDLSNVQAETLEAHLDTAGLPPPDLIVRTSGEQRLSNFLLWQASYAEFCFPDTLWPDFDRAAYTRVLQEYQNRDRRFGGRKEHAP